MPLYNYSCDKCIEVYEFIVPLDELEKEVECPDCGENLKKLLSAPAFYIH
jgi:putative FmdB family regulatory protein